MGGLLPPAWLVKNGRKVHSLKLLPWEGQRTVSCASGVLAQQRAAQGKRYRSCRTWGIDGELACSGCLVSTQNKGALGVLLLAVPQTSERLRIMYELLKTKQITHVSLSN